MADHFLLVAVQAMAEWSGSAWHLACQPPLDKIVLRLPNHEQNQPLHQAGVLVPMLQAASHVLYVCSTGLVVCVYVYVEIGVCVVAAVHAFTGPLQIDSSARTRHRPAFGVALLCNRF